MGERQASPRRDASKRSKRAPPASCVLSRTAAMGSSSQPSLLPPPIGGAAAACSLISRCLLSAPPAPARASKPLRQPEGPPCPMLSGATSLTLAMPPAAEPKPGRADPHEWVQQGGPCIEQGRSQRAGQPFGAKNSVTENDPDSTRHVHPAEEEKRKTSIGDWLDIKPLLPFDSLKNRSLDKNMSTLASNLSAAEQGIETSSFELGISKNNTMVTSPTSEQNSHSSHDPESPPQMSKSTQSNQSYEVRNTSSRTGRWIEIPPEQLARIRNCMS